VPNNKDNQHCLNCASFQPYENDNPVETANGECRRKPQIGPVGGYPIHVFQQWPYIADGDNFWCGQWKISLLPAVTQEGEQDPIFPDNFEDFHADPWNVREPLNESCWSCNNFQHGNPLYGPLGECRFYPPPSVYEETLTALGNTLEPVKFNYAGDKYSCSCWERNPGTIPPIPSGPAKGKNAPRTMPTVKNNEKSEEKKPEKKPEKKS